MESARCAWEVTAGLIPGTPMPEFTRRFVLTSNKWYGEDGYPTKDGLDLLIALQGTAMMHALSLMDPQSVNWVRLDWIWF